MIFVVAFALAFSASWSVGILYAAAPTVTTGAASSITKTTATLDYSISDDGGEGITSKGFEYGTTPSYGSTATTIAPFFYANDQFFGAGGAYTGEEGQQSDSLGITRDTLGNVYVAEYGGNRIQKFNSSGVFQSMFGWGVDTGANAFEICTSGCEAAISGSGNGQFNFPSDIAVDSSGNIYVLDSSNNRVQKFNSSFAYQSQFGTLGASEGQFGITNGIEVDELDNIYIVDALNNRIQKFNSSGVFQSMFGWGVDTGANVFETCTSGCQAGISGSGNGQFDFLNIDNGLSGASDIAFDSGGNIYIVDSGNSRIQKFSSSGNYISQYGTYGTGQDEFVALRSITIDQNDDIYAIYGTDFDRVKKLDSNYNFYFSYIVGGPFNLYSSFVDLQGNLFLGGTSVVVFYVSQHHGTVGLSGLACGTTYHYRAFATNADGTSYGSDATFTTTACEPPTVETKAAHGVAATAAYLNGMETDDGVALSTVRGFQYGTTTSYGSTLNETPVTLSFAEYVGQNVSYDINFATAITRDSAGLDYVASKDGNSIQVYDDGSPTLVFGWGIDTGANSFETCGLGCGLPGAGISGAGDGQFDAPEGVAVDSTTGYIYVADTGNDRIQVFDSSGTLVRMFGWGVDTGASALEVCTSGCQAGIPGNGSGQYNAPKSLAITRTNGTTYLYAVDFGNNRIQKLTTLGVMVDEVGGFSSPGWITVSQDNEILLADTGNNRIVSVGAFDLDTEVITLTEPSGWTAVTSPTGVVKDSDNNLIITESGNDRVVFAAPNGNSSQYKYVMAYGSTGTGENQFDTPTSLYLDDNERLIIADSANNRVLQLSPFMSSRLKPISCGTLYHYRAFATNTDGTGYGADETFTTSACGTTTSTPPTNDDGCTDPLASNYDSSADNDDGSCEYAGCTDVFADNYNSAADNDDGSCVYDEGCTDNTATNFDPLAITDDGSCLYTTPVPGCTNPSATNYNPLATVNDGSCIVPGGGDPPDPTDILGCTDTFADNYDATATYDDGTTCEYTIDPTDGTGISGCTSPSATNYNASATTNDGSCIFPPDEPPIITTIVEVVENITGMDRDEQIKTYKDVATLGIAAPAIFYALTQRAALASLLLRLWNIIPTLLGFRRRRRPWGTVYDSVTKQPLDPVYVTLRDKEGAEVSTSITDIDGRYGFVTDIGSYVLDAKKGDYIFPSAKLKGLEHDELYEHLYFGEQIDVDTADSIINKNIPMDAVNFNWNEFEKAKNKKLMKFFSRGELFLARIARVIFFAGLIASIMLALLEPHFWNYAILGLYILIIVLMLSGVKPRQPGFVVERSTGYPLSFAILTVYSAMLKREVAHTIVGKTGKYHVLVPKGRYYIKLQKKTGEQTYEDIYISDEFKVRKGYIDKVIKI